MGTFSFTEEPLGKSCSAMNSAVSADRGGGGPPHLYKANLLSRQSLQLRSPGGGKERGDFIAVLFHQVAWGVAVGGCRR